MFAAEIHHYIFYLLQFHRVQYCHDNYEHHTTIKHTGSKKKWYKVKDWFWNKEDEHKKFERGTSEYKKRQLSVNPGPNYTTEDDGTRTYKKKTEEKSKDPVKKDTKKKSSVYDKE